MTFRYLAEAALAVAIAALPASAQSVAEQLQKGIYAQQTLGDLDGAIRIFRQIIASKPAQPVYAAQAQTHLAQALLQQRRPGRVGAGGHHSPGCATTGCAVSSGVVGGQRRF
jgi:hypothetical protein